MLFGNFMRRELSLGWIGDKQKAQKLWYFLIWAGTQQNLQGDMLPASVQSDQFKLGAQWVA